MSKDFDEQAIQFVSISTKHASAEVYKIKQTTFLWTEHFAKEQTNKQKRTSGLHEACVALLKTPFIFRSHQSHSSWECIVLKLLQKTNTETNESALLYEAPFAKFIVPKITQTFMAAERENRPIRNVGET